MQVRCDEGVAIRIGPDAIHAVLCGAGHNLRLILAHLRVLFLALIVLIVFGRINAASTRRMLMPVS